MTNVNEYLITSTIHGLRYLSNVERTPNRIIWGLILVAQFSFAVFSIYNLFDLWNTRPAVS